LPFNVVLEIIDRKGLPKHTDFTITDRDVFLKELEKVKQKGYALDLEENEYGIRCIAVPIFDYSGNVVAAISISGPTIRMTDERIEKLQEHIQYIGRQISKRLGYRQK
jgi:IclR family KDG regulon transcriptional repressor